MTKNILIGVAWPYVNGDLHIGHLAGYLLPADIFARYSRLVGNNVLMVSGSDCFGTPITVEADKKKVKPTDIVETYHSKDVDLFTNKLKLSYDLYTLTNTEHHIKITQEFFLKMLNDGYIFIDTQEQYYSPTESKFLPDRYVVGTCPYCKFEDSRSDQCDNCGKLLNQGELLNPLSTISKEPVELRSTQHYFIDWPKLEDKLSKYVESKKHFWKDWVAQETLGWLREGLKPRAITRDLDWGVSIPVDRMPKDKVVKDVEHKRIYVWFDAVIGYYSASLLWAEKNVSDWQKFWLESAGDTVDSKDKPELLHYYFMGKDNLVFHTLFWPGQLMTFDNSLHLPDVVSINMFLNNEGKQFSKSRGWSIPIDKFVDKFGNDALRFYLTLIMPETRDSSFTWSDFLEKNNGILVANLGNFVHRVLTIAKDVKFSSAGAENAVNEELEKLVNDSYKSARHYLTSCEFRNYLKVILDLAAYGNALVDKHKLWELKKTDSVLFDKVCHQLLFLILALGQLMAPLLFEASDKLGDYLFSGGIAEVSYDKWPVETQESKALLEMMSALALSSEIKPLFFKIKSEDAHL